MERIAGDEVHVYVTCPSATAGADVLAAYDALMTEAERTRQRAFVFERNRIEFLYTRALVRTRLSRYRDVEPSAWRFRTNAHGRPEPDPPCGLTFNLSNHPSMVVLAIAGEGIEVGIDVEPTSRGEEILGVADTVFSARERSDLVALSRGPREDRAVTLWTLKEAYIKARGMGLALPLQELSFVFDDPARTRIEIAPDLRDDGERWTFSTFDLDGHRIALAVAGVSGPLRLVTRTGPP